MGWLLNGSKGALIAGVLFILPGMVALLALSGIYVASGDTTLVEASFLGLAPAVVAIVLQAVIRVARKGHGHLALIAVAVGSFIGLTFFAGPFTPNGPPGDAARPSSSAGSSTGSPPWRWPRSRSGDRASSSCGEGPAPTGGGYLTFCLGPMGDEVQQLPWPSAWHVDG